MDLNKIQPGLRVKTTRLDRDTRGMFIVYKNMVVRREGVVGTVKSYAAGHGGDVWFVAHDGSDDVGAYIFTEFEPITGETTS